MTTAMKRCGHCHENKTVGEFHRDRSRKDGLFNWCKSCVNENVRQWQKANPDKKRDQNRRWWKAHPDKAHEKYRRWWKANADKERERNRRWQKANPDKVNAIQHRRRARKNGNGGSYTAREWKALCERQAHRCACCGEKKPLTVDHILPIVGGGSNDISNIQALCLSCNSSKGTKHIDYRVQ